MANPDEEVFDERAAIIEHEGGIPREWADGLARLCVMKRPQDIPQKKWDGIVAAAGQFADRWAKHAAALGWTTEEVFGVHHAGPTKRYGSMGLLYIIAFDPSVSLVEINTTQAVFHTRQGAKQVFQRSDFNLDHSLLRKIWDQAKPTGHRTMKVTEYE